MKFSHYKRPPNLCLLTICLYWQIHLNCALFLYNNNNNNNNNNPQVPDQLLTQVLSQHLNYSKPNNTQQLQTNYLVKWEHDNVENKVAIVSIKQFEATNLHEPRVEVRLPNPKLSFATVDERAPNNTLVAAVMAWDEDEKEGPKPSVSIEYGNELGHFKVVTQNSITIQTSGHLMSRSRQPDYNLTIVARDHGTPPKSSSTNLVIKLISSPNSLQQQQQANMNLIPSPEPIQPKPPVTDLMYVGAMLVVIFSALIFLIIIGCALVQRPKNKSLHQHHHHSTSHRGPHHPAPSSRATSASNSRLHPTDQCSAYCLGLTNLA